jgi:hypothetical protein
VSGKYHTETRAQYLALTWKCNLRVLVILPLEKGLPVLCILLVVCSLVHPDLLAVSLQEVFGNPLQVVLWIPKRLPDVFTTAIFFHDLEEFFLKLFLELELHEDVDVVRGGVHVGITDKLQWGGERAVIGCRARVTDCGAIV